MFSRSSLSKIIECLIFVSEDPLTIQEISSFLKDVDKKEIIDALDELQKFWAEMERGFVLSKIAERYQFRTRSEYSQYIVEFNKEIKKFRLSKASLEVLAIVAYKQPVTKIEVEKIRGVDCSSSVSMLLERRFIETAGRKEVPGKPFLYKTTNLFLETFGLKNLKDLPTVKEIEKMKQDLTEHE